MTSIATCGTVLFFAPVLAFRLSPEYYSAMVQLQFARLHIQKCKDKQRGTNWREQTIGKKEGSRREENILREKTTQLTAEEEIN
jgi:hypothetical protein